MALKVVGAGFGRTGTLSLKSALEKIGFGPCYHMMEVFAHPEHIAMWHRAAFEGTIDWDLLFRDFKATVDWPSTRWWREIAAHFPDAKVLLSVRDPEAWYKSMTDTIYQPMKHGVPDGVPEMVRLQSDMVRKAILADTFDNRFEDKAHAIEVFQRNVQKRAIPSIGAAADLRRARRMGAALRFTECRYPRKRFRAQRHRIDAEMIRRLRGVSPRTTFPLTLAV